jgi:UDP-N-acetylmuramoylalanine--D-glutamate ligase
MLDEALLKAPMILGLGRTGLSFVRFFKFIGVDNIQVWDENPSTQSLEILENLYPHVKVKTSALSPSLFEDCSCICISPGVPRKPLDAMQGIPPIISEFDIFALKNRSPVIAVTGSNGKSTVCDLLFAMAKAQKLNAVLAGNFGISILDTWMDAQKFNKKMDIMILELSSFQLESIAHLHLSAAVVLNLTPNHLDRYDDFNHYARVKNTIYDRCDFALYSLDFKDLWPNKKAKHYQTFATKPENKEADFFYDHSTRAIFYQQKLLTHTHDWRKKGRHYAENVIAALALGTSQQWDMPTMLAVASQYLGLKHRCQWVATIQGVAWYNDSKATTVESAQVAIEAVAPEGHRLIWIAGGRGKGTSYTPLKAWVEKTVKCALLLGEDAHLIAKALENCVPVVFVQSLQEAVQKASAWANSGDVVLLSPACASFDMFKNFEDRGDCFIDYVEKLKNQSHQSTIHKN